MHGNSLRAIMIKVGLHKPEEISSIDAANWNLYVWITKKS